MRLDGRQPEQARPIFIQTNFIRTAAGSCLIATGNTRVICTASVEDGVPPFLRDKGQGWVTAEYAMLPASTGQRKKRDGIKKDGRSVEIQRLIGRSLRQAVDLTKLGERTITLDCDVLEADGGTRTAGITGAAVALSIALNRLVASGELPSNPMKKLVSAVSVGKLAGEVLLDLCYVEDRDAEVDMNVVMTEQGEYVEVQGSGEEAVFTADEMAQMLALARKGMETITAAQKEAIARADAVTEDEMLSLRAFFEEKR